MIAQIIHIGTTSSGGMNSVVNSYIKFFGLPKKNYWSSHDGSFILSLLKVAAICLKILFSPHEVYHLHMAEKGSVVRKFIISTSIRLRNKKYIVHLHGRKFQNVSYTNILSKNILSNANAIICITEQMKNFIIKNFQIKNKIFVIPNICENTVENFIVPNKPGSIRIIYCGTFIKSKGVFDLLDAFEKCRFDTPVVLELFGNGNINQIRQVKNIIEKSEKKEYIKFMGWVNHDEYLKLLPNYDFLVLPSKFETFGLAYVEAMALGIPVIGTFGPAIPEIVRNNKTGLLIEYGNVEQLKNALEKLTGDKNIRLELGRNAWEDVRGRFSPEIILQKLEEVYGEV
jgi:glycosyltransferase involved in cell wall biosynthesis